MRTTKKLFPILLGWMMMILMIDLSFSCKDDDNGFIAPIAHNFKITYGKEYKEKPVAKAQMILTNNEDGKTYKAFTDAKGIAKIEVIPGTYKASVSRTLTPEEYLALSGQKTAGNITFNGSVENLKINQEKELETTIELVTGRIGNLVLSQIYYAGSDVKLGAKYRDQFFEVHNNSNQTQYLDGLYFAQIKGKNTVISVVKDSYLLPNGQYDWSRSVGQKDLEKANTDYVYADEVIQFPGSGEDYPLASGKSAIVAATAINHKQPLTVQLPPDDFRGKHTGGKMKYEVSEPWRTIDLHKAPFECYYRPYQQSLGEGFLPGDIDNLNAVNMKIAFKTFTAKDLMLDSMGRDAFVIFRIKKEVFNRYDTVHLPLKILDNSLDSRQAKDVFKQIPISVIMDGVDVLNAINPNPKRLPDAVDAGQIANKKGKYSSESVIRKVSSQIDGKTFYQDTNNSTNDFKVLDHPQVDIDVTYPMKDIK